MSRRILILCEGPADVAGLRELLSRRWGFDVLPATSLPAVGDVRRQAMKSRREDLVLVVQAAKGRTALPAAWTREVRANSPSEPYGALGVCFDPNGDSERRWRELLFEKAWSEPLVPNADGDYQVNSLPVVPLPWSSESPVCSGLEDWHSLDRIIVTAARVANPPLVSVVDQWIDQLRSLGREVSWKTAARLWHAVLFPDRNVPDVASQTFGQDAALWSAADPLLRGGTLWLGMSRLLGVPI